MGEEPRRTTVSREIRASPERVFAALMDPGILIEWLPPEGMRGVVHAFDARPGGRFRISLTYQDPRSGPGGKTSADTDVLQGRFESVDPPSRVAWLVDFESGDPAFAGTMRVTWELRESGAATRVRVTCVDVPRGILLADNEAGSASSLRKLADLLERG